jgi:hypothetical protein
MLITNHVLSGALVGALVDEPAVALPVGVASHFALDAAPHWGKWESDAHFLRVAVADGLLGLGVMAGAFLATPRGRRASVLAGMVGAALPDLDKPARIFFGFSPFPRRWDDFHSRIQDEAPHRFYSHELRGGTLMAGAFAAFTVLARKRTSVTRAQRSGNGGWRDWPSR